MSYMNALQKIDEVIVGGGGAATIPFSGIDQRFRSLQLLWDARCDAGSAQQIGLQLNGDTGSNYYYSGVGGTGTSASAFGSNAQTATRIGILPSTAQTTGMSGAGIVILPNYAGTTFWKNYQCQCTRQDGGTGGTYEAIIGTWRSTAAITSILLFPGSGNFIAASVASLYGCL